MPITRDRLMRTGSAELRHDSAESQAHKPGRRHEARELWEQPVSYAAVGATKTADLMKYPPKGYRPLERRVRIGHGNARFDWAWTTAMSWGVQKNSGITVEVADAPPEISTVTYTPVEFDDDGNPIAAAATSRGDEAMFGPDGTPFLAPGDTAVLGIPFLFARVKAPVRVVYVVDEPHRKGFAYGTLAGHPESGEESWIVERRSDGSVWLTIRAFARPSNALFWFGAPLLRLLQEFFTRRYERALTLPIT